MTTYARGVARVANPDSHLPAPPANDLPAYRPRRPRNTRPLRVGLAVAALAAGAISTLGLLLAAPVALGLLLSCRDPRAARRALAAGRNRARARAAARNSLGLVRRSR